MKRIFAPIDVETEKGWPVRLEWKGRAIDVLEPADYWVRESRWWARRERRAYFFLRTTRGALVIYRSGSSWTLAKRLD